MNLNDDTVSGFEIPGKRAFGVQFHPEAAPGPHDSLGAFDDFLRIVTEAAEDPACH